MRRRDLLKAFAAVGAGAALSVREARIEADDVLVLEVPEMISVDTAEQLKQRLERVFPGRKAIVLCDGIKLSIVKAR